CKKKYKSMITLEIHYRKLENMYHLGPINRELYKGVQLTVSHERAEIIQPIESKFFHAGQSLHGSVYFKLLDDAAYFAVQSTIQDFFIFTTTFNIQLLRPVTSGTVKAVGKLTFKSKNLFIADAILYDEKNREVARGSGTFIKSQHLLSEKMG
ncbi:MAG TPA: PaaI family thioesterase, partial [Flavobacterium sp.]|nr:PaaI family thioesterase [Flavobacterium sp.]